MEWNEIQELQDILESDERKLGQELACFLRRKKEENWKLLDMMEAVSN